MVHLGIRLQAVVDMVDTGSVAADIGCDHALVCIALIERGISSRCYACDVAQGPLSRARQAIEEAGLQGKIIPVLQDGIVGLADDVDTVIIASHTDVEKLRRFLSNSHFVIDQERIVKERHYYQIIKAHHEREAAALSEDEILFGLHRDDDPLFREYWERELEKCRLILSRMPLGHERRPAMELRCSRIQQRLNK